MLSCPNAYCAWACRSCNDGAGGPSTCATVAGAVLVGVGMFCAAGAGDGLVTGVSTGPMKFGDDSAGAAGAETAGVGVLIAGMPPGSKA